MGLHFLFFLFFFFWTGVWVDLALSRQVFDHLNYNPSPFFYLIIFQVGSCFLLEARLWLPSSYLQPPAYLERQMCATTFSLFFWDEVLVAFSLSWSQTEIFLISISWVAGIAGMNHGAQLRVILFYSRTKLPVFYFGQGRGWGVCHTTSPRKLCLDLCHVLEKIQFFTNSVLISGMSVHSIVRSI
jgi:hypothetical protein